MLHPAMPVRLSARPVGGGRAEAVPGPLLRAINAVLTIMSGEHASTTELYIHDGAGELLLSWDGHRFGGDTRLADLLLTTARMMRGQKDPEFHTEHNSVESPAPEGAPPTQEPA